MSTTDGRRGLFVTFEGTDGSGKTTQIQRLANRLRSRGCEVLETAEPGGTRIGAEIRRILLDPANQELSPTAELLLYFASRAQNVDERIRPALEQGKVVISDRFTDSTLVYQGAGRGLSESVVRALHRIACGTLEPDLTIYLDIDLETSLGRAKDRNREQGGAAESRMDEQSLEFHQAVRARYLKLAEAEPRRIRVIDGRGDPDTVERAVWEAACALLEAQRV